MVVIRMFRAVPRRFGPRAAPATAVPRRFGHAAHLSRRRPFASERLTGVMGLPVDAAPADVKRRYRALALETHPDRLPGSATAADRERARQRFARLSDEYDARLAGRPPRDPYEGTLDPVSEADQMRALAFMVAAKLATIFVPIAGLAAAVVARAN